MSADPLIKLPRQIDEPKESSRDTSKWKTAEGEPRMVLNIRNPLHNGLFRE